MIDYHWFGEIAYNLKAYAKSLYYLEMDFLMNNDPKVFEKLIKLYYELDIPECAFGLIKLANQHEYEEVDDYKNKFIWYINLNDYRKGLEIIEEQLKKENDIKEINFLKKNKKICLNGLFNWEEILLEEDNEINGMKEINKNNEINETNSEIKNEIKEENNIEEKSEDKYNEIKEVIEKELFLSDVYINLDKWDNLKYHILKINKKLKENFDLDEFSTDSNEKFNNSDLLINKNKSNGNKDISFIQQNEKLMSNDYISYNNLILKNIYLFNKINY